MLQQSSEQIVPSGAKVGAGTVNESKDIRQIGMSDTICLCGKGAAGALAQAPSTMAHQPTVCRTAVCSLCQTMVGQSELRRVRDFPVDQKGGCFVEAPGSTAVSCLDFRFLAFVRKADRHKPQWIQ